ncbi:MAG: hypothetical protein KIT73_16175 [Burkholderiales bacterium]|nr:hypothetical protein [Burkholderiales bacterium]
MERDGIGWLAASIEPAYRAFAEAPCWSRLTAVDLKPTEYGSILGVLWSAHTAIENRLREVVPAPIDHELPQLRSQLLLADIAMLRAPRTLQRIMRSSDPGPLLPSALHALGALYVLEGPDFSKRVPAVDAEDAAGLWQATTYFRTQSVEAVRRRQLIQALIAVVDIADRQAVIDGALATFAVFMRRLAVLHEPGTTRRRSAHPAKQRTAGVAEINPTLTAAAG